MPKVEFYCCVMQGDTIRSVTVDIYERALDLDVLIAYELWKIAHGLA